MMSPRSREKITLEKVEVNPNLEEILFVKPQVQTASNIH